MISKGKRSIDVANINSIKEIDIAAYYLGITKIPCLIHSPLRKDNKPSFALYSFNGTKVFYKDFSTKEGGTLWSLLMKLWNCTFSEATTKVYNDFKDSNLTINPTFTKYTKLHSIKTAVNTELQCKIRNWEDYDLKYWGAYGISLKWLKYAQIYPISHKIIIKDGIKFVYKADKYAYAYVEFKENKTTLKIYQPFNINGYKWSNKHDKSVISLWTKIPKMGNRICICASMKDALCLWANAGIVAIAIQGEGYNISNTTLNELKKRFKHIYICLDNDKTGLVDAKILADKTGFTNIVLPQFEGGKDISDFYQVLNNKEQFKQQILKLFTNE